MPPGRSPTSIGEPLTACTAGSTRMTEPERASATQTRPWATVIPAGWRPAGIDLPIAKAPRPMWCTWPVVALETQSEPAPAARRSGAVCGPRWRRTTRPPLALTAVIPAPLVSATQIRPPP
jgi:hypothetical protein